MSVIARETTTGRLWEPEYDGQPSIADLASCLADCSDEYLPTRREALFSLAEMRELRTTWIGGAEIALMREIDAKLDGAGLTPKPSQSQADSTRETLSELSPLFGVPFRFWVCPRGCRGPVTWSETGATCAECGASSGGAPEDLAAYVEALAVEHGGIAYAELMALASQDVDADRLLLAVEGLVNRQTPRLARLFVDQASRADLPEEEVSRLLGLAAGGDPSAMEGLEVVYRPVLTATDPGA